MIICLGPGDVPYLDGFVIGAAGEDVRILGIESHAMHPIAAHKQQVRTKTFIAAQKH